MKMNSKWITKMSTAQLQAKGSFSVALNPLPLWDDAAVYPSLGRRSIAKSFSGDLVATSVGEMLSAGGSVSGSAGYVAIERVTGSVAGRQGSFSLMHRGVMDRGAPSLTILVVPDSGEGELAGIRGTMDIQIKDGQHFYQFDYSFSPTP
jgi:hypothetical protein